MWLFLSLFWQTLFQRKTFQGKFATINILETNVKQGKESALEPLSQNGVVWRKIGVKNGVQIWPTRWSKKDGDSFYEAFGHFQAAHDVSENDEEIFGLI